MKWLKPAQLLPISVLAICSSAAAESGTGAVALSTLWVEGVPDRAR